MVIESSVLAVGKTVGERAARAWLAARADEADRNKELSELIQTTLRDQIARRRLTRQLEDISDSVAERLLSLCAHEYQGMTENDKIAALLEVGEILKMADLSDKAIFAADADPRKLGKEIRSGLPRRDLSLSFGERELGFLNAVLDECCVCLVAIIRELPQFNQRATGEVLSRLSGLAEQVGAVLARLPARSLYSPSGSEGDLEFRDLYLSHLSNSLDTLELFGVRVERYRPRTTLTVAYISLSVSTEDNSAVESAGLDLSGELKARLDDDVATVRVEAALGANKLTLIRGEAGSGKSTLIRWLAINAARGRFVADLADWNGHVPFLIKLRSYADRDLPTPEQFLDGIADMISGLMPVGWVHRQLKSGRVLLLIDGVDELPARQRRSVRTWLAGLISLYSAVRVVVTSRPAAAGSDWLRAENFSTAFLEKMSMADLSSLIHHWHAAARDCGDIPCPPEKLPGYEASLLARLETAPHLKTLASSPLLAAMLCALNLDRETQLPPSRMGLYQAALELLLERRDAERQIPIEVTLEADQKVRIIQDLAWRLSVTGRTEIPRAVAERRVADAIASMPRISAPPDVILEYLIQRSGVIREPVVGRIDFVHRTVQEYLTAKQAADDGDMEALISFAHRDQWRETIIMAAGHANAPLRHQLLTGILDRIKTDDRAARRLKLLLGACLETLPIVPPDLAVAIDHCIQDLIPPRDMNSARTVASVGEHILTKLPASLAGLSVAAARATIGTAWMINGPGALSILERYSQESGTSLQSAFNTGWHYFDAHAYAKRVLANIPHQDLRLMVNYAREFSALGHLPQIQHLDLMPLDSGEVSEYDFRSLLSYSDSLRSLTARFQNERDLLPNGLETLRQLKGLNSLNLGLPFRDLEALRGIRPLDSLTLTNLDQVADFSPLIQHNQLKYLNLSSCRQLTNLGQLPRLADLSHLTLTQSSFTGELSDLVAVAPHITSLGLRGSDWLSSLEPLPSLSLTSLTLWDCKNVRDIGFLGTQNSLSYLDLEGTGISDLRPLSGLQRLDTLWLRNCSEVNDLSPLENLSKLRRIFLQGVAPGINLAPLSGNRRLTITLAADQDVLNRETVSGKLKVDRH